MVDSSRFVESVQSGLVGWLVVLVGFVGCFKVGWLNPEEQVGWIAMYV